MKIGQALRCAKMMAKSLKNKRNQRIVEFVQFVFNAIAKRQQTNARIHFDLAEVFFLDFAFAF